MPLKLYNTLTRRKEDFIPLDPQKQNVRVYVCGPTVYDHAHIGNARPVIVFDVLFRLLRHLAKQGVWDGGKGETRVTYVRNITDVDDKINARAREEGVPIRDLTERTAKQFHEDIAALGVLPPTHEPRATEYIGPMIELIERLIAKGHAYAADGHVLFDVTSTKDYGRLSRRSLDELIAGARVEVAPYKKGDMDFVLWKPSDKDTPGWDSPWGRGRPGWHIECSAMSWKLLGETFDIHGGGIDLVFPHHENELAQNRCVFGHNIMANVWMHNGFLQVEGQKMSKSLGNFVTINELLNTEKFGGRRWHGEVLRTAMLLTHYRQPLDFSISSLEEAGNMLRRWRRWVGNYHDLTPRIPESVVQALKDDLNTPAAFRRISELSTIASGAFFGGGEEPVLPTNAARREAAAGLLGSCAILGIDLTVAVDELRIAALIAARLAARKAKNWAESDRIRDELAAMGIAIKDNKDGTTTWEVKR